MNEEGMFITTEKGYRFLELFAELQDILWDENTWPPHLQSHNTRISQT
jgi:hypothetical protein